MKLVIYVCLLALGLTCISVKATPAMTKSKKGVKSKKKGEKGLPPKPMPTLEPTSVPSSAPSKVPSSVPSSAPSKGMMGMGMMGMGMGDMTMTRHYRARELEHLAVPESPPLPSSYSYNPSLSDLSWKDFTLDEFYDTLQCEDILEGPRPIHDDSTWNYLQKTYEDVVGSERSSIQKALTEIKAMDRSLKAPLSANDATSIDVNIVPKKGRGIIAQRDIKKGEHIWSDTYLAAFYDMHDLNRYLAVLPPSLACDVILWKYDHDEEPIDDFFYSVNLDISSFCNDGGSSESNILFENGPIANNFIASRDINAGEEILCDYGDEIVYN